MKRGWGRGDASILINQIVSKLGTGTSFTHNVYIYITLPPNSKMFTMRAEPTQVFCGTWMQIWPQFSPSCIQGEFVAPPTKRHDLFFSPLEFELVSTNRVRSKRSCSSSGHRPQQTFQASIISCHCHANKSILDQPAPAHPLADHRDRSEPTWDGPSSAQISGSAQQMNWLVRNNKLFLTIYFESVISLQQLTKAFPQLCQKNSEPESYNNFRRSQICFVIIATVVVFKSV